MLMFVSWAELFISALADIGDFLLYRPFNDWFYVLRVFQVMNGLPVGGFLYDFLVLIDDLSIGVIIFGNCLICVLVVKVVKFFT